MKKLVIMGAMTIALTGCASKLPANLADKALFACQTLDGELVTVAVDVGAAMVDQTVTVGHIRALRQHACASIAAQPVAP